MKRRRLIDGQGRIAAEAQSNHAAKGKPQLLRRRENDVSFAGLPPPTADVLALVVAIAASISSTAYADSGSIRLSVVKGGWFIGSHGGSGVLVFHGRRYPLSVGGVDAGLVFGASETEFYGRISRIRRPSDVAGV